MTIVVNTFIAPNNPNGVGRITATSLINKAAILLQDVDNTRWPREELLGWLNDAQRQIVMMKPTASAETSAVLLARGAKQLIPNDGWQLLDVIRNMGKDGETPGRVIRVVSRKVLDAQDSNWHATPPTDTVINYIFNMQDGGQSFYVYPPSNGLNYVELIYSRMPNDLEEESGNIDVNHIYQNALVDYIVYRAASKDAENAPMLEFAKMYLEMFNAGVQSKDQAELENNVNMSLTSPVPPVRGNS
jgi:hypothetical protein